MSGFVSLVGAGPGDPDLLTRRALDRLEHADVVLYDALVSPDAVAIAARAQRFCVGKRHGRRSIRQETIHRLMIGAARRGRRVVRLKCGDPFVLGRGGEEALALAAAGVPYEIVPGLSAATAAPALAGIPVTHRGLVSGFVVVSGHSEAAWRPLLDALPPGEVTVVILMGLAWRAALADALMRRGWPPSTPAAVLLNVSHPDACTWTGRLADLGAMEPGGHGEAAGTIVVGSVVALRALIRPADAPAAVEHRGDTKEAYGSR
jgi:uroporphyrin-III C-methyltransferase